jgi:hypothetical protein
MSKRSPHNDFSRQEQEGHDVIALIKRMQQQLAFLEKKIDLLISQSQSRPSAERHFSKPFGPAGHLARHSARGHDRSYGERQTDRGRHFGKRRSENNRDFGRDRQTQDKPREGDRDQEHHFEDRHGRDKKKFKHKGGSFYDRRKGRE